MPGLIPPTPGLSSRQLPLQRMGFRAGRAALLVKYLQQSRKNKCLLFASVQPDSAVASRAAARLNPAEEERRPFGGSPPSTTNPSRTSISCQLPAGGHQLLLHRSSIKHQRPGPWLPALQATFYPLRGQQHALLSLCAQPSSVPKGLQGFPLSASAKSGVCFFFSVWRISRPNQPYRAWVQRQHHHRGCRTALLLPLTLLLALGANLTAAPQKPGIPRLKQE